MTTQNKKPAPRKAPAKRTAAAKPSTKRTANPTDEEIKDIDRQIDEQVEFNERDQAGQDLSGLDAMLNNANDDQGDDESLGTDMQAQKAKAEQDAADEAAARAGAAMAVGFCESLLGMKYPFVSVPKEQKHQIIEKATPVMRKYGGGLPEWLRPYQEEIELGMVVATAGVGIFMQVQHHKHAEQKRLFEERRRRAAEARGERQPDTRVDLSADDYAKEGDAKRVDAA